MTPTVLPAVHVDPAPGPAKPDPPAGTPETPAGTPSTAPHRSAPTAATVEANADSVYISHQAYEAALAAQLNDAPH
jgi:hypothetical protein